MCKSLKCVRCWRKTPQVHGLWCQACYDEMQEAADARERAVTCQAPRADGTLCRNEALDGSPFCRECYEFFQVVSDANHS